MERTVYIETAKDKLLFINDNWIKAAIYQGGGKKEVYIPKKYITGITKTEDTIEVQGIRQDQTIKIEFDLEQQGDLQYTYAVLKSKYIEKE